METSARQLGHESKVGGGTVLSGLWQKLSGKAGQSKEPSMKEALEDVLEEHQSSGTDDKTLSSDETYMLRNVLSVGDLSVKDVMIPRSDIIAADYGASLEEIKNLFITEGHSRIPVYDEKLDDIKGFLHLKDFIRPFSGDEEYVAKDIIRDIMFVSPSMRVVDLLMQMRQARAHMAIVVDEYGGTDGLVTMEDLFEEIVGEIQDEHDVDEPEMELRAGAANTYEVDARYRMDDLEEKLGIRLNPTNDDSLLDVDTIGGFLFVRLGRVPARGEMLEIEDNARIEVMQADARRIRRVKITLLRYVNAEASRI